VGIELQIQSSVLAAIAARSVQTALHARCFDPIGSAYIDHADVAADAVELSAAGAAVRLRVPVDLFVVSRAAVLAAPNGVPAGATGPADRAHLVLELAASGTVVSMRCVDVDLGPFAAVLGPGASAVKAVIVAAVGEPARADLSDTLEEFGMTAPSSSRVEIVGALVAIRFEPVGGAVAHLPPGVEWGLFLDGASVERLARSQVADELASVLPSVSIAAHWRPAGATAHVDVDYGATIVAAAFSVDIDGTLGCDFALAPAPSRQLRTTVHWSLHVDLGDLVPGFVDNLVEKEVEGAMDPAKFGGTSLGDHAFFIDRPLPAAALGGARLDYGGVFASPAGMVIGGPVRLPLDPGRATVQLSVHPFGLPTRLTVCSVLAKSGSGEPSRTVSLGEATTTGRAWLEDAGAFGAGPEILPPNDWVRPYMSEPGAGAVPELRIVVPSAVALGITTPVQVIVRAARGVRLIDLGAPPPAIVDADGNVTNARRWHIRNCNHVRVGPDEAHGIDWGVVGRELRDPVINPHRLAGIDWTTFLAAGEGVDVQLMTLHGLEPGELIRFRSRDHAVDVTADRGGRATVPVVLSLAGDPGEATLERVNRRGVAGHFTVRTATFQRRATFPAGRRNRLIASGDGTATLTSEFGDRVEVRRIGPLGALEFVTRRAARSGAIHPAVSVGAADRDWQESHGEIDDEPSRSQDEASLNPQPLPPVDGAVRAGVSWSGRRIDLPGLASVAAVPGFAEAPIALAAMTDGSTLVLDLDRAGAVRVAGTFAGPIGALEDSGDWAFAVGANRVAVYRLTRA
jgi:hypothetical protein